MEDWAEAPLSGLVEHLLAVHHTRTRASLDRLSGLLDGRPAVAFAELRAEVEEHMRAEEERLFPAILALDRGEVSGFPVAELPAFEAHHVRTAAAVRRLLEAELAPAARSELQALEDDLREHLHEEHNVLFPRALAALGRAYA